MASKKKFIPAQTIIPFFEPLVNNNLALGDHELVVDNFAGGGGASTGIEAALERPIDIAINHDREAIAMHRVNHPQTLHYCESVWDVDPVVACAGRPVGLAWFSPDCTHFSKAKGGKPVKKEIRGLSWVVIKWVSTVKPRVIMMENVEEIMTWGPVIKNKDGKYYPDPNRKGKTFRSFISAIKRHGYAVEYKMLRACDYGAPTIRKRFFLIARCDGQPIVWPDPSHGNPKSEAVKNGKLLPWRVAAECIDWNLPCPSIFDRKKPLAEATLRRIAKGIKRYVMESANPFIVTYYGEKVQGEFRGQSIADPLATQTTENRHALVMPHITKFRNNSVGAGCDEPLATITANSYVKRPGGAAPLGVVSAHIMPLTHQGSDRINDICKPMPTITAAHRGEHALVVPHLIGIDHRGAGDSCVWDSQSPLTTVTAEARHAIIGATLVQTGYGEREGQEPRVPGLDKPLGTVVAGGVKHALVSGFLAKHYGGVVGTKVEYPVGTVTAKDHHSLVTANMVRHFGESVGASPDEPVGTIMPGGMGKTGVVTSHLIKLRGTCKDGQPVTEPMPTITAGGTHVGEVRAFLIKYYGIDVTPDIEAPLATITTKDRFGLVTIEGQDYEIVDIGMRMLAPRELFLAQGFPRTYIIDRDDNGRPISKTVQVSKCGNSVPPNLAEALVRANYVNLPVMSNMPAMAA